MSPSGRPLALVTGASSGIGTELARQLAADGFDLALTSRTEAPMLALATEIETRGGGAVVIPADLARAGAGAKLAADLDGRGLSVDLLVNNAGLGAIGGFDRIDPVRISEMLQVNIVALTELTRILLPGMLARRRGRILLVASIAGFLPGPQMAVYSATKAYVLSFGEALAREVRGSGVTVTTLCPGATATNFFNVAGAPAVARQPMMSAAEVARIGYRGCKEGRAVVVAGFGNRLLSLGARFSPHSITLPIAERLMSRR